MRFFCELYSYGLIKTKYLIKLNKKINTLRKTNKLEVIIDKNYPINSNTVDENNNLKLCLTYHETTTNAMQLLQISKKKHNFN